MQKNIFIFFGLFIVQMNAQIFNGKIFDSKTKLPLESAAVFVENSSVITLSKKDGSFQIDLKGIKNNVIIDYIGYETYVISKEDLDKNNVLIYLKQSDENLAEMIIHKAPFSRKEMMKCFKKYFLGTTPNAKGCKILNEDDIVLYYDLSTFTLRAEASEPLVIENKNLGYQVSFLLTDFRANFRVKSLEFFAYLNSSFKGYSYFEDYGEISENIKSHRRVTYKNSMPHILKSLATDNLEREGYTFYVNKFPVRQKDYFEAKVLDNGSIIKLLKRPTFQRKRLKSLSSLSRVLTEDDYEMITEYTHFVLLNNKNKNQSIFEFIDEDLALDNKGNLLNTDGLLLGGFHGSLKVGDMLPVDYEYEK